MTSGLRNIVPEPKEKRSQCGRKVMSISPQTNEDDDNDDYNNGNNGDDENNYDKNDSDKCIARV